MNLPTLVTPFMRISVNDFFKPVHQKEKISDEKYREVKSYLHFARSLSEVVYQTVYLIDYYQQGFLYVSSNPIFLCGSRPENVLRDGYLFYLKNVPESDLQMLLKINEAGLSFFNMLPVDVRLKYSMSYDFHLKQPGGSLMLINHKLKPLILDRNRNPWIALCLVSLSSNAESGNVIFKSGELNKSFQFNFITNEWEKIDSVKLNSGEKEVLILSAQGLTTEQIAARTYLTTDAIKFRKKNIFSKLKVKNITEAITAATNLALI